MNQATIYTLSYCPYCIRAKQLLKRLQIKFEEIDITNDPIKLKKLQQETGLSTAPQIWINDTFIGGCDELYKLHEAGNLQALLTS